MLLDILGFIGGVFAITLLVLFVLAIVDDFLFGSIERIPGTTYVRTWPGLIRPTRPQDKERHRARRAERAAFKATHAKPARKEAMRAWKAVVNHDRAVYQRWVNSGARGPKPQAVAGRPPY